VNPRQFEEQLYILGTPCLPVREDSADDRHDPGSCQFDFNDAGPRSCVVDAIIDLGVRFAAFKSERASVGCR